MQLFRDTDLEPGSERPERGSKSIMVMGPGTSPPCWYHVWVVPVSRAGHWLQNVLMVHKPVQDGEHTAPGVLDVVIVAPEVTDLCQLTVVHLGVREAESSTGVTLCCPQAAQGRGGSAGDRRVGKAENQP